MKLRRAAAAVLYVALLALSWRDGLLTTTGSRRSQVLGGIALLVYMGAIAYGKRTGRKGPERAVAAVGLGVWVLILGMLSYVSWDVRPGFALAICAFLVLAGVGSAVYALFRRTRVPV
jgi:uncharacterized membrane protein